MNRCLAIMLAAIFAFTSLTAPSALAEEGKGKLESVESEIEKPEDPRAASDLDAKEIAAHGVFEILMQFFLMGLMQAGMEGFSGLHKELKKEWSPVLPTVRLEPSYQYVAGGLSAFSAKGEVGYLVLGADGEYSRYFEKSPKASLDIWSAHFLLRTMFTRHFGTNLALGAKGIRGSLGRTGFEIGLPFYIAINNSFVFDVLPYLATVKGKRSIYDLGAGVSYKWKFIGARAGYRAIFVGDERLHGPRIGVFFQW